MAQPHPTAYRSPAAVVLVLVVAAAGLLATDTGGAAADVVTVRAGAAGITADLRVDGGTPRTTGPEPAVELAPGAGGPVSADADEVVVPAGGVLFRTGPVRVRSEGSPGPRGQAASAVRIHGAAPDERPGPFRFDAIDVACTADEDGSAAAVRVAGGWVDPRADAETGRPLEATPVQAEPARRHTVEGRTEPAGEHFRITFNEQAHNADGSLTVTAARIELLGPSTTGQIIVGQAVCGVGTDVHTTTAAAAPAARPPATTPAPAPVAPLETEPAAAPARPVVEAAQAEDVTAVTGSAFGFVADVSLFGGPSEQQGPEPTVALAPDASNSPQTAAVDSGVAQYGPAQVVRTGPIDVRTAGSLGADGAVTSSATVQGDPDPDARPGPLLFEEIATACTADPSGVSASTTFTGGVVETRYDPDTQLPVETQPIPATPPAGHTVEGTIDHVGDRFRIVFNERVDNGDGSVTVNAARMELLGPIAVGEVIIGQTVCGVQTAASPTPPPTPSPSPTPAPSPTPSPTPSPPTTAPKDGGAGEGVTAVAGSAFGFFADVSLFGGPSQQRGPEPTVTLASDASNSPEDARALTGVAQYGPAQVFRSGPIGVRTEGALGADGYVASSVSIKGDPDESARPGPLVYDAVDARCRADEDGVDSEVMFTGAVVETSYDPDTQLPVSTEPVPANPPPGYTVEGTIDHVGDRFRIVFNEHVDDGDGSITVNAAHMHLLGPIAVGELVIGQVQCAVGTAATGGVAAGGAGSGARLASTGSNPAPAALLATGLMLAGVVALRGGRRAGTQSPSRQAGRHA